MGLFTTDPFDEPIHILSVLSLYAPTVITFFITPSSVIVDSDAESVNLV